MRIPPNRPLVHGIDQRVNQRDRAASMNIAPTRLSGFMNVTGTGEVSVDVAFPIWFIEKPSLTFGAELADGHSPEATNFPTVSVMVLKWRTETRGLGTYWVGATLGVVTTGKEGHETIVHWQAEAKALQNPKANIPGFDEAL